MNDPVRRAIRTLLQFVAAGGLTAFVDAVVADIEDPRLVALVMAGFLLVVTYAQNELEDHDRFPAVLKEPSTAGDSEAGHADTGAVIAFCVFLLTVVVVGWALGYFPL